MTVTPAFLDAFADAWNRHDTDAILAAMTPDCIFEAYAGPDFNGTRYAGQAEVRRAVETVFAMFSNATWSGPKHLIVGDRGVSEWVFTATTASGAPVEVQGCDLFTFRDDAIKNSYRKQRKK